MRCPNCGELVPANEWAAYRRHEDCAMGRATDMMNCGSCLLGVLRSRVMGGERKGTHISEMVRQSDRTA
jgi:hypothetical protein